MGIHSPLIKVRNHGSFILVGICVHSNSPGVGSWNESLRFWTGKTYRFRISNVGITTSINFRIQGHKLLLVEVEGTHTLQNTYDSLDIHLGQSLSVLVTADQPARDYYIVASTRFTSQVLATTAILHYSNSAAAVSGPPPGGPTTQIDWSLEQARSIRYCLHRFHLFSFFLSTVTIHSTQ